MNEKVKVRLKNEDDYYDRTTLNIIVNSDQLIALNRMIAWLQDDSFTFKVIEDDDEWEDLTE